MWETPEPECWLHPDVEVRPSGIAGMGLFTREALAAGTAVSRLGGRLVTGAELTALLAAATAYVDTVAVGGDLHLVLPPDSPNGKGNHSCDPNLWWDGPYTLAARRDIAAGEELTNDYATGTADPGYTLACGCGCALCRSTVTGLDWKLPDLQHRYADHWTPALLSRLTPDGPATP